MLYTSLHRGVVMYQVGGRGGGRALLFNPIFPLWFLNFFLFFFWEGGNVSVYPQPLNMINIIYMFTAFNEHASYLKSIL